MSQSQPPVPTPGSPTVDAPKPAGVETTPVQAPDLVAQLKAKDETIATLTSDRDNYRTGMLKYKKQAEDGGDPLPEEEKFRQIAREELMNSEIARANAEKDELIKKIARENEEMRIAIQNKAQVPTLPGGSSEPGREVIVDKLTAEQKADLTRQAQTLNVDPKIFIDNFLKNLERKN